MKRRIVLVVLGLVLLAVFIWLAGPYFAFAESRPLESGSARLLAIVFVVVCWAASALVKRLRAARASDQLMAAMVKPSSAESRPSAEALQLRERFEEAVATLKRTRRSGRSLYDLPWYVIIGAPGSGKTTALVNSGLNFPLEQRVGKGALRGVGGTRNCDWWFTDEAVFLDTAGRYTTQDSDEASDAAGWAEFLALLRKYRRRRPLNGVILTISAQDLMTQAQGERDSHIMAARRRLDELNRELRIQLPVYLMVTKCDLVAGFTEYFDDLARDGRAQVWGVTFPYEQSRRGEAARTFDSEFDGLVARLNERMLVRLEQERDPRRRAQMFAFPQQMVALRELLAQFVSEVFASNRFDQQALLRGVYFTSGTQEGTPVDRLLGALSRRMRIAAAAVPAPPGKGKAYFIERLLREVIFAEAGLAGVNRRLELQQAALQVGAYAAMLLVAALGVVFLSVSYRGNKEYLAQVDTELTRLRQAPPVQSSAALEAVLPRLDAVRAVVDAADRYRSAVPWRMRWGLYQGAAVGDAARDAYVRELDDALLPHVAGRIKERLSELGAEPDKLYEYLKTYLMLGQPEHLDKAQLAFLADLEWKRAYGSNPDMAASVTRHFHSLLEYQPSLRPIALDATLIAQARSTIQQASIPRLMYGRLKFTYAGDTARALRIDEAAGVGAQRVLRRKSGATLSEPVPSLYTRPVFEEVAHRNASELVAQFAADRWVWGEGEGRLSLQSPSTLAAGMMDVYEKDYIAFWDALLADVQLVPFASLDKTADALAILSGPASPLRAFLQVVDANTYLVKPPDPAPQPSMLSSAQKAVTARLGRLLESGKSAPTAPTAAPGAQVTAHFDAIHKLVTGAPGSAPIDRVLGQLAQVKQQLQSVGTGLGQTSPLQALATTGRADVLRSLQQDAATLPPPVSTLIGQIAGKTEAVTARQAGAELENRYEQDVLRDCNEVVSGHYPFAAGSATDVTLADFGRLFGYGGVFDTFFKTNLESLVDTSRSPWTWRPGVTGASVGVSASMLRQFEAARRLRETFFRPGSQTPELHFTLMPTELDPAAARFLLEIDGQSFDYRHGPERSWPASWPGPNPGAAAVTIEDRGGARPNAAFSGPWAWFRLLDAVKVRRESDVRYLLQFDLAGHQASVRVEAASIRNPYARHDLQQFRCGH